MKRAPSLIVLTVVVLALGSMSVYAAENPPVLQQAQSVVSNVVNTVLPQPSPTPDTIVGQDQPSPIPIVTDNPTPIPSPTPAEENFPVNQSNQQQTINAGQPQATQQPVPVPQTAVFVSIDSINGIDCANAGCVQFNDSSTGGVRCNAPCTIVFHANFQGGFPGVQPYFVWSNGSTYNPCSITFTSAGFPKITVEAYEDYQGHHYAVGSANIPAVTIQ